MKVSIIIPVYNVEKYIDKCIQSVMVQSYTNIEILMIDDGSTDKSGEICDQYALKDRRIRVLHKQNGGLSSARNVGAILATGESIFYLDSDDYLSPNCIEKCVDIMKKYMADIAIIKLKYVTEDNSEKENVNYNTDIKIMNSEEAIEESLYQKRFSCCAPGKLYKRKIIEGIDFPEGKLSEDLATCHLFLDKADRIVFLDSFEYYYLQHDNSIMHTFNPKRMDAVEWTQNIIDFCKEKYPNIYNAAICRKFNVAVHLLFDLPMNREEYIITLKELWDIIKETRVVVILDRKSRVREKSAAILSFAGYKMLKMIWNSKLSIKKTK